MKAWRERSSIKRNLSEQHGMNRVSAMKQTLPDLSSTPTKDYTQHWMKQTILFTSYHILYSRRNTHAWGFRVEHARLVSYQPCVAWCTWRKTQRQNKFATAVTGAPTPRSELLLDKLTLIQPVKKCLVCYGAKLTRYRNWGSIPGSVRSPDLFWDTSILLLDGGKVPGSWSSPLTSIQCRGQECRSDTPSWRDG
jgi:hypothetical protein